MTPENIKKMNAKELQKKFKKILQMKRCEYSLNQYKTLHRTGENQTETSIFRVKSLQKLG